MARRSQSGAALNTDVLYLILDYVVAYSAEQPLRYQFQQAALLEYSQVNCMWCQAAQGILFRHVLLQIRSTTTSFLRAITPTTSRGRSLVRSSHHQTLQATRNIDAQRHWAHTPLISFYLSRPSPLTSHSEPQNGRGRVDESGLSGPEWPDILSYD